MKGCESTFLNCRFITCVGNDCNFSDGNIDEWNYVPTAKFYIRSRCFETVKLFDAFDLKVVLEQVCFPCAIKTVKLQ